MKKLWWLGNVKIIDEMSAVESAIQYYFVKEIPHDQIPYCCEQWWAERENLA